MTFFKDQTKALSPCECVHHESYLHERVTVVNIRAFSDVFEAFTDVWKILSWKNIGLMLSDQRKSHTEENLRALVEQTVPDAKNRL